MQSDGDPTAAGDFADLAHAARAIVQHVDPAAKVQIAKTTAKAWFSGRLGLGGLSRPFAMPDQPGRPPGLRLLAPREMPKRSPGADKGRFALLHAMAHIELSAVDMTWDLVGRFTREPMPGAFFDDWVQVGLEEAKHFALLSDRLGELGGAYGDLPAHDGLWQSAQATGHDLLSRLAVVPLVLEARGLDVTPVMLQRVRASGDARGAKILERILDDEIGHVRFGAKHFIALAQMQEDSPEQLWKTLVARHFGGSVKPPFNDSARSSAGLPRSFYAGVEC